MGRPVRQAVLHHRVAAGGLGRAVEPAERQYAAGEPVGCAQAPVDSAVEVLLPQARLRVAGGEEALGRGVPEIPEAELARDEHRPGAPPDQLAVVVAHVRGDEVAQARERHGRGRQALPYEQDAGLAGQQARALGVGLEASRRTGRSRARARRDRALPAGAGRRRRPRHRGRARPTGRDRRRRHRRGGRASRRRRRPRHRQRSSGSQYGLDPRPTAPGRAVRARRGPRARCVRSECRATRRARPGRPRPSARDPAGGGGWSRAGRSRRPPSAAGGRRPR